VNRIKQIVGYTIAAVGFAWMLLRLVVEHILSLSPDPQPITGTNIHIHRVTTTVDKHRAYVVIGGGAIEVEVEYYGGLFYVTDVADPGIWGAGSTEDAAVENFKSVYTFEVDDWKMRVKTDRLKESA
jgi:hypothetical protein